MPHDKVILLPHDPNSTEWVDNQEQIRRFEERVREKRTDFDGQTVIYSDWSVVKTWEERKRSSLKIEWRVIDRVLYYLGDTIGGKVGVAGAGGTAGGTGAALGGLLVPIGMVVAGVVCGYVIYRTAMSIASKVQMGWLETRQRWVLTRDFDGSISETKVGPECLQKVSK
jgi:hypothetical protein